MAPTLGQFIRTRRTELGLTQEQLAERVGSTLRQAEVSRLERDRVTLPRRERLAQLAEALEVSFADLFIKTGWIEEKHRDTVGRVSEHNPASPSLDVDPTNMERLAEAVETLAEVKGIVNESVELLEDAEEAVMSVIQSTAPGKPPIMLRGSGEIVTGIGLPLAASHIDA